MKQLRLFDNKEDDPEVSLEIKIEKLNIIEVGLDLLGERIKKSKEGNYYKGLCPFHYEKTPSFYLRKKYNRYVCFGCQTSGKPIELIFELSYSTYAINLDNKYFPEIIDPIKYLNKKIGFDKYNKKHLETLKEILSFQNNCKDIIDSFL